MTKTPVSSDSFACRMLMVRLGEDLHALPIQLIEEVLPALPIGRVPHCPAFIRGVIFVRGHLIPVLDAAERLGLRGHEAPSDPHIVCLRAGDRLVGVLVDEALDLVDLSQGKQLSLEEIGGELGFCSSVVDLHGQLIRILNPARLIAADEGDALKQLPQTASRSPF